MITAPNFDISTHVSISPWKAAITVPAKHHSDSINIFHLEIGILHISGHPVSGRAFHLGIVIFHISIVGERATDVRRAVVERTPIHTHIYRYEARGGRMVSGRALLQLNGLVGCMSFMQSVQNAE